ncbi:TonB-dependent receptor [Sphingopyxis lindanitolerans]|nr:TonB-dependent receptor [Sphingopyxis lindanitolerans]
MSRRTSLRLVALTTVAVSQFAVIAAAAAQQADEAAQATGADRDSLEIVVTAQKRVERLQDVPIAVSAVSGDQLETLNINDPRDLRYVAPSLNFSNSANVRGEGFSIRGVGTAVFADTVEQSVGTVIDGVPLARAGQAVADLVDIERVEVLRGPQGMLFGKNASAGVISITTKAPQFDNSFEGRISYGTYDEIKANAIANVALADNAAIRVAYSQTKRDGIVRNIFRNEMVNDRDSKSVRAKLRWEPTSNLSINLIGDWGDSDQLCCAWTARTAPVTTQFGQLNAAAGITPGPRNLEMAADQPFFQEAKTWGASAQIDFDADWATFTSITAYRHWDEFDGNDPDILPINYLRVNNGFNLLDQYSQELRMTSPSGGKFEWVGGAFLSWSKNQNRSEQTGALALLPAPLELGSVFTSVVKNESAAIFGQLSYSPIERLKLILGARYTAEKVEMDAVAGPAPGALAGIPGRFVGLVHGQQSNTNLSGRATIQYNFTRDVMLYATAARGYKGPGIDTLGIVRATPDIVQPEIPTSYELGLRSALFNRTTIFNVTAFATDFKDYQASSFDTTVTPSRFLVTNAGKLRTRGIEAELQTRPLAGLALGASVAYIKSKFADFKNISCYSGQTVLPLGTPRTSPRQCILISPAQAVTFADGNRLPNSPRLTYNLNAGYEHHIGDFRIDTALNWFYRSKVSFDAAGNPATVQGGYGVLNGNIGFGPDNDSWRLSFFARNILDRHFVNVVFVQPVINSPGVTVQIPSPDARRLLGVALDVKFGGNR